MQSILFELWTMFQNDQILQLMLAIVFILIGFMFMVVGWQMWVLPMHWAVKTNRIDIEVGKIWYLLPAGMLFFSFFYDGTVPITVTLFGITETFQTTLSAMVLLWLVGMGFVGTIVALFWSHYESIKKRKPDKLLIFFWVLIITYYFLYEFGVKKSLLFHGF